MILLSFWCCMIIDTIKASHLTKRFCKKWRWTIYLLRLKLARSPDSQARTALGQILELGLEFG